MNSEMENFLKQHTFVSIVINDGELIFLLKCMSSYPASLSPCLFILGGVGGGT